jgi:CRP/FNR family transcriptional regulator, cyclic AMP receptor protein
MRMMMDQVESKRSCEFCPLKREGSFCCLSPEAARDFEAIKFSATYPTGTTLFQEREQTRGVYLLCAGKVKLTMSSSGGKTLILRLSKPGEMLGLMAAISNGAYEATAETLEPSRAAFIRQEDFSRFIAHYPEVYLSLIRQSTAQYSAACEQIRTIALTGSSREKLARLLLLWSNDGRETAEGCKMCVPLTHEQIAECVGSTRETVTRTLSEFKSRHLVTLRGATMLIPDRNALAAVSGD